MKSNREYNKGFTLIELLVVISIVSMLSSVVYAALGGVRERAVITSGQEFAASQYHAQGADIVASINFDNSDTNDNSGLSSQTIVGGVPTWSSDTHNSSGKSMFFNGTNYIEIPNAGNSANAPRGFSYSLWVKPTELAPITVDGFAIIGKGPAYLAVSNIEYGGKIIVNTIGEGGGSATPLIDQKLPVLKWTQLTMVVDATGKTTVYMNGKSVYTNTGGILSCTSCAVRIGSFDGYSYAQHTWGSLTGFKGYMDDIRIYNYTLTTSQVEKLYAESIGEDKSLAQNLVSQE